MEMLSCYGLFLAKIITILITITIVISLISKLIMRKQGLSGQIKLVDLSTQYRHVKNYMKMNIRRKSKRKSWYTSVLKKRIKKNRSKNGKPILYVIDFKGSTDANEVFALREEITAILSVADSCDEVLVRLESSGGFVHSYGLVASQLERIRNKNINLTVVVDKIAASGGYMVACVANNIIAAPFSVIGSIGVVAQIPNFNRLLKHNKVDVELHTAGKYKRTLTMLGENTESGREKFIEELNITHDLFKRFVHQMRPNLNIDEVSTGSYWYGLQAIKNGLVDKIGTSDDFIIKQLSNFEVFAVHFVYKKKVLERFVRNFDGILSLITKFLIRKYN